MRLRKWVGDKFRFSNKVRSEETIRFGGQIIGMGFSVEHKHGLLASVRSLLQRLFPGSCEWYDCSAGMEIETALGRRLCWPHYKEFMGME